MAYYGDQLNETLSLNQPLHAEGKVGFHRGVSDSTTLIGFFHSDDSMRSNNSQNSATPENFVGAAIEGPSAEGFYFYPTYGLDQEGVRARRRTWHTHATLHLSERRVASLDVGLRS